MSITQTHHQTERFEAPVIADRYIVADLLGSGGAAKVYLVFDQQVNQWRALKRMLSVHSNDDTMRARFAREGQAMSMVQSKHVVQVHCVDFDNEFPFLVMDLKDGGSVLEWMRRNGPLDARRAARVMLEICSGLSAVHKLGVVHRDVKPHNILIDADESAALTDFGIAKIEDGPSPSQANLTVVGTALGTDSFMAPEQRNDAQAVDHLADIYGAGASLFTILTARAKPDLFLAKEQDEAFSTIPESLVAVVRKACAYDPKQRFQSANEMKESLQSILSGLPATDAGAPSLVETPPLAPNAPSQLPASRLPSLDDLFARSPEQANASNLASPTLVLAHPPELDEVREDAELPLWLYPAGGFLFGVLLVLAVVIVFF